MKLIIAGNREFCPSLELIAGSVRTSGWTVTELVSGGCRGVDQQAEQWAAANGIPVKRFNAEWSAHGRAAGPIRNAAMVAYAEGLLAFWDGESKGTRDVIEQAKKRGLPVVVERVVLK